MALCRWLKCGRLPRDGRVCDSSFGSRAEGVLGLILVAVVLVALPLTVVVVLIVGPLKSWEAYVGILLLHAVPCL